MPKKPSLQARIVGAWPLIAILGTLIGALITTTIRFQAERDALDKQLRDACMRIETLERVVTSEFPLYSASFYYLHAPSCWK